VPEEQGASTALTGLAKEKILTILASGFEFKC